MPRAGQRLRSLDFVDAYDMQTGTYEVDSTGDWGAEDVVESGDYSDCAVVIQAPTSGRIRVDIHAELNKGGGGGSTLRLSPEVRHGPVIGSGSVVYSPGNTPSAVSHMAGDSESDAANTSRSGWVIIEGLEPGQPYSVRVMHRGSSGSNGQVRYRQLLVSSLT